MTTDYRNARRELREARDVARENAETIVKEARKAHRDLEPIEAAAFKSQTRAAIEADQALRALGEPEKARPKRSVYTEDGRDSYFIDLIAASSPRPMPGHPPHQAQARLAAHRSEREKYKYIYDEIAERRVNKHGAQFRSELGEPMQYRDLSQTAGLGLEFDSPTWVLQKFVTTVLAAAPLLACSDNVPLPAKTGFEVLIPRFDTAAVAAPAPPPPQNIGLPADNTETDSLSSFVTMIPSQTTVSYQALEQGNVDAFVAAQAAESIAAQIESTLWSGLGEASGEPVGVLNSGIGAVATPGQTPILVAQGAAAAMAIVGKNRLRPATHLFGTPERWEVTFGYQDGSNNEPLTRPGQPLFDEPIVGSISNRPCIASGAMPTAIGGGSADTIVAARPKELLVFTSDPVHRVMPESYGAALAAVVQSYVYMAAIVRYPTGFCWVSGLSAPA